MDMGALDCVVRRVLSKVCSPMESIFCWVLLTFFASFLLRVFNTESLESPCIDFFHFFANFRLGMHGLYST